MEKAFSFLRSTKPWRVFLVSGILLVLLFVAIFISPRLRQASKIKLGADTDLIVTADREDALGAFIDTKFTLKSNKDLAVADVRNSITFFPETAFDVQEVSPRQFNISPKTPLKNNNVYRIQVLSESKTYSWAFQTKNDFRIVQTLPRDRGTFVPLNTGIEVTFSHDNWDNPDNYFSISPKVEGRFERHKRTLSFIPKSLSPDTLYTVTIKKGLRLKGSTDSLQNDFSFKFETKSPENTPVSVGFSRNFYEFSTSETPAFDVFSSVSDQNINIKVYQYPSESRYLSDYKTKLNIPYWATNANRTTSFSTSGLSKIVEFSTPLQKQVYTNYFMLPQTLNRGFYLIEAKAGNAITQSLFQVTNLSAYLSVSGSKTLAWVNDLSSGNPIEKAKVSFAGKENETGSDGVAYFDTPLSQLGESLEIVTVRSGDNLLILPPQSSFYYGGKEYQNSRRLSDKYWSYLYADRPTYLPQDTVKLWGLLRDRDDLKKKQKFTVEVSRSDYNSWNFTPLVLYSKDVETNDLGTFLSDIPLTNYNPGYYTISLKVDNNIVLSSAFSVGTYTKPAYQITIDSSRRAVISGETVTLSGKATFFEGTPVSGMSLKYTGSAEGTVTTDTQGSYSFQYTPRSSESSMDYSPEMRYINIMPARQEEGMIQSGTSIAVYNSALVFGSPKQETKNGIGVVDLNLRLVDTLKYKEYTSPEEIYSPAVSRKITGYVMEIEYVKREAGTYYDFINKLTSPRFEYDRVQNKIADISLETNSEGKASFSLGLKNGKSYDLIFETVDDQGRVTRQRSYLYGSTSSYPRDNYVYLKTDKTGDKSNTYSLGEPVSLTTMKGETPIPVGPADKFLYIWAQRGIKSYQVSNKGVYSFNYPEAFVPNVTVQAIHFTGKTYEVSESLYLNFDTSSKKISLSLTQNKTSYAPGETAKISIETKNPAGSPLSAEVNLNLIDEAYYKLYPQSVNPLNGIYRSLDSDILASYYSHRYPLEAGGAEQGGCFLPGTQILMSDGSTQSIEKIKEGDSIKTLANPSSSKLVVSKVLKTYKHLVSGYLLINNNLRVTGEHNLYINGRWLMASEAKVGDEYLDNQGNYKSIRSIEAMSGLNTVYNLSIENEHTYIANGFYVHNEKGRELFVDNAFFGNLVTNKDGKGSVDIKLPDNLTSWRITSQAISSDLQAGSTTTPLIVKQPFFIDLVLNTEYLTADRPTITLRAFGESLSAGESVNITLQIPTLEIDKQIVAKAFESVQVNLGTLKAGEHKVVVSGNSSKSSDKITRTFRVIDSRLKLAKSTNVNLENNTIPVGSTDSYTKLVFSDQSLGRYYPSLVNLSSSWGDRLDQKISRVLSQELIKKYFDNSQEVEQINITAFQTADGGYAIYPYAGTDITLSSYMAAISRDKIDVSGLSNYLYRVYAEAKDVDTASKALFGLASLQEPVLLLLNNLTNADNLTPMSRIYLAMGQAQLGDIENANLRYRSILSDFAKTQDNLTYAQIGKDKDSYLEATSTLAALASLVNAPETDSLFAYTVVNSTTDVLLTSSQILTIRHKLENSKPETVSFAYALDGKKVNKTLEKGQSFVLMLSPSQLSAIKFSDIVGNIGLTTAYTIPLDPNTINTNKTVSVNRNYSVSGTTTTSFSTSDLIKVTLSVSHAEVAQDGCYQVSDLLPSGFKPITNVYSLGFSTDNIWYPYEINGQKVSFCVGKGDLIKNISYYARVISAGDYKSESALIQSLISPSVYNLSPVSSVSIK